MLAPYVSADPRAVVTAVRLRAIIHGRSIVRKQGAIMKIQEQDLYHGPALMQIAEHPSFTGLNKADAKYGHYIVNADRRLFVKYSSADASPWPFTFQPNEMKAIQGDIAAGARTFVCLICGESTICCLNQSELVEVIKIDSRGAQWVRVEVPKGGSQHVSGSRGKLRYTIPHNAFPAKVLE